MVELSETGCVSLASALTIYSLGSGTLFKLEETGIHSCSGKLPAFLMVLYLWSCKLANAEPFERPIFKRSESRESGETVKSGETE